MNKTLRTVLIIIFAAVFLLCAAFLADYLIKSVKQQKQTDDLASLIGAANPDDYTDPTAGSDDPAIDTPLPQDSKYVHIKHPVTGKYMSILREYAPLYELNHDFVGWIRIDGTKVSYPVMQSPEWVNYYLKRDFYGNESRHGTIYANESANLQEHSDNITLYGHKMKDGSMFASLHNYKDKAVFDAQPYIEFDTIYDYNTYQIMAVFITDAYIETGFAYHNFVDGNEESFNAFVAKCKELALYDTGVDAVYGDKLLTLSTCEHSINNGRFVVVAKKIS
ncbi:MAG: class B sortase [Oscillospiraceae bacterium]|nr:class B sortase [Oscillospiraceae bacterium]